MTERTRRPGWGQLLAGIVVLALGVALLLSEMELLRFRDLARLWPLIVIAVGGSRVIGGGSDERPGGYVVLFIGCWLLLVSLGAFGLDWSTSWPLALVAVGLGKLLGSSHLPGRSQGAFLIVLGGALQAMVLGLFDLDLAEAWPVLLVVIGLWIILRAFQPDRRRAEEAPDEASSEEATHRD